MKERPILFSGNMIEPLLSGRKTQTRRLVTPMPVQRRWLSHELITKSPKLEIIKGGAALEHPGGGSLGWIRCPCEPGDLLWVKETHKLGHDSVSGAVMYRADMHVRPGLGDFEMEKWRPSIHMPKSASRITLEVKSIRVERLRALTVEDAEAEGLMQCTKDLKLHKWGLEDTPWQDWRQSPVDFFIDRWSRDGSRMSWQENPWVWVTEFKKVRS